MSTRCHILFADVEAQLLTYKHCDDYPEGTIPLLREFWHWYPRTEDLEYLTATWVYFCKRQTEERIKRVDWNDWCDNPMKTNELHKSHPVALSYGICAEGEGWAREDSKGSSASSCERCGSTEGTNWVVQAGTPAGEDLNLTDDESVELCDGCMQEVSSRIGGEDENARNESIRGDENE